MSRDSRATKEESSRASGDPGILGRKRVPIFRDGQNAKRQ